MCKIIGLFIRKIVNKKSERMCNNCDLDLCEVCNCNLYCNLWKEIADNLIIIGNWNKC